MYYIYIVTNKNNSVLYIGVASDLAGRIHQHRERLTEGFTKRYQATKLIIMKASLILSAPLLARNN